MFLTGPVDRHQNAERGPQPFPVPALPLGLQLLRGRGLPHIGRLLFLPKPLPGSIPGLYYPISLNIVYRFRQIRPADPSHIRLLPGPCTYPAQFVLCFPAAALPSPVETKKLSKKKVPFPVCTPQTGKGTGPKDFYSTAFRSSVSWSSLAWASSRLLPFTPM